MLVAELEAVPKRLWQFQRALSSFNNRATLPVRQAPFSQQFSLWPCHPPPGEGTRPTSPEKSPACRPGALTRHPHLVHNEQAKCYRTWQGRVTFWGRRKLRPAILWCSLLPVSGCSRTGSIEVTWKNCCRPLPSHARPPVLHLAPRAPARSNTSQSRRIISRAEKMSWVRPLGPLRRVAQD